MFDSRFAKIRLVIRAYSFLPLLALCIVFVVPSKAFASVINKPPSSLELIKGLVGYWSFDGQDMSGERAYDRSGNSNTGVLTNGPARTTGKIGQALKFDGTNDFVLVPNSLSSTGDKTATFWVYPKNTGSNLVMFYLSTSATDALVVGNVGTTILASAQGSATFGRDTVTGKIANNQWSHIAVTKSGSDITGIFVNGVDSTTSTTQFFGTNANASSIGSSCNTNSNCLAAPFNGLIDDVRIYNRVLSAEEIKRLYNIGATLKINKPVNTGSLSNGLVGHWTFDASDMSGERAYDRSGNANTGTLTNGPVRNIGKLGQALSFDGSNDYVDAGNVLSFDSTNPFTISAWVRRSTIGSAHYIVSKQDQQLSNATGWSFYLDSSNKLILQLSRKVCCPASYIEVDSTDAMLDTGWVHYVVTYNGSSQASGVGLYKNGSFLSTTIVSDTLTGSTVSSDPFNVGSIDNGYAGFFNGLIDEVRIYNRALSPEEIKRLYNIGATLKINKPPSTGSLANGLIGHWTFDGKDMAGERAYDLSGNSNTGVLTNGPARTTGKLGQALSFDGSNDYVDASNLSYNANYPLTVTLWIFPRTSGGTNGILHYGDSGSTPHLLLRQATDNSLRVYVQDVYTNYGSLTINAWNHIAIVRGASGTGDVYINGVDVGNITATSASPAQNARWWIGRDSFSASQYFNDLIDDVRIYNRALSPEEVKRLYNTGR